MCVRMFGCVMRLFVRLLFAMTGAMAVMLAGLAGAAAAPERIPVSGYEHPAGTIVVKTGQRRLYLILGDGTALRYTVGVGRQGQQWSGAAQVDGKYKKPAWSPPDDIRRANPKLPKVIAGGAPNNPMGVAALTLSGGEYAIHGTNDPKSVGGFVSHGCIRMHNADILDLYRRVDVGARVIVVR